MSLFPVAQHVLLKELRRTRTQQQMPGQETLPDLCLKPSQCRPWTPLLRPTATRNGIPEVLPVPPGDPPEVLERWDELLRVSGGISSRSGGVDGEGLGPGIGGDEEEVVLDVLEVVADGGFTDAGRGVDGEDHLSGICRDPGALVGANIMGDVAALFTF